MLILAEKGESWLVRIPALVVLVCFPVRSGDIISHYIPHRNLQWGIHDNISSVVAYGWLLDSFSVSFISRLTCSKTDCDCQKRPVLHGSVLLLMFWFTYTRCHASWLSRHVVRKNDANENCSRCRSVRLSLVKGSPSKFHSVPLSAFSFICVIFSHV